MAFKQNKNPISRKTSPINKDWIAGAIKRPGALRKKAEAHDMSTKAFANEVISNKDDYSTRTGRQAELAETLMGMSRHESGHVYGAGEKKSNSSENNTTGTINLSDEDFESTLAPMEEPGKLSAMKDRKTDKDLRTDRRSWMYDHEIVSDLEEAKEDKKKINKSPLNVHDEAKVAKLRAKARKLSEPVEQGDYDYENPEVVKLLDQAKKIEATHKGSPVKFHEPKGAPAGQRTSHKSGRTRESILAEKNQKLQEETKRQQRIKKSKEEKKK